MPKIPMTDREVAIRYLARRRVDYRHDRVNGTASERTYRREEDRIAAGKCIYVTPSGRRWWLRPARLGPTPFLLCPVHPREEDDHATFVEAYRLDGSDPHWKPE